MPSAPRLAVFSPLPPMPTGIADYCLETLTPLARDFDCTAVVEDGRTGLRAPPGVRVIEAHEYRRTPDEFVDALHLYHLGNNPDHVYMLPFLWARPGLVVLHDPSLHHLLDCATAALGDFDRYAQAIEAEYGVPGRVLAAQFRRHWLRETRLYYDMPMIRTLAGHARGVIVHSRYAAAKVLAQAPEARVSVVPHQFSPPPDDGQDPQAVRASLGIGRDEVLFLSIGFASRVKAIDSALRALARIRHALPPFRYVIAGRLVREDLDVPALAASLGIADRVVTTGYLDEAAFFPILRAADVVINLRHPIGGETSGTLIRALGSGACVVVVDRGPFAEIPDGAAVKLAWGAGFEERLAEALLALARDPARRQRIGARARAHTVMANSLEATIAGYRRAIRAAATQPAPDWASPVPWRFPAPHALRAAVAQAGQAGPPPLWVQMGAVPNAAAPCRALLVSAVPEDAALLRDALGQVAEQVTPDVFLKALPAWPARRRSLDLVLLRLPAETLVGCEAALLRALNAALRFGGLAVLQVTARDAGTGPFFRRDEGAALFEAAGFRVDAAGATPPVEVDPPEREPEEDGVAYCWRAGKSSEFIARPAAA